MVGTRKPRRPMSQSWGLGWGAGKWPALPAQFCSPLKGPSGEAGDSTVMPTVAASGATTDGALAVCQAQG